MAEQILFPPGRLVWASGKSDAPFTGRTTDQSGRPLLIKSGPNVGKPKTDFSFGVAIPKTTAHWGETDWGRKILQVGAAAFPNAYQRPNFAWKIIDGDSTVPNENNKIPCQQTGYAGNWIVKFSGGFAPKIVNENGTVQHNEPDYIRTGYYVQVFGSVDGNGDPQKSGVFINHSIVSFQAYGEVIQSGPDAASVGFGGQALPAGASAAPIGGMSTAQAAAGLPALPGAAPAGLPTLPGVAAAPAGLPQLPGVAAPAAGLPQIPGAQATLPGIPGATPPAAPAGLPVTPNPAILAAPPRQPVLVATAKAGGQPLDAFRQGGWTDQQLLENGYAVWQ